MMEPDNSSNISILPRSGLSILVGMIHCVKGDRFWQWRQTKRSMQSAMIPIGLFTSRVMKLFMNNISRKFVKAWNYGRIILKLKDWFSTIFISMVNMILLVTHVAGTAGRYGSSETIKEFVHTVMHKA